MGGFGEVGDVDDARGVGEVGGDGCISDRTTGSIRLPSANAADVAGGPRSDSQPVAHRKYLVGTSAIDSMDKMEFGLVLLVAVGVVLVLTAPPAPIYDVGVAETTDAAPEEVTPFVELDTAAQREFLDALVDGDWSDSEEPALKSEYVGYKGDHYRVYLSVSESSVASLLQPVAGGGLVLLGVLAFGGRRIWQRRS